MQLAEIARSNTAAATPSAVSRCDAALHLTRLVLDGGWTELPHSYAEGGLASKELSKAHPSLGPCQQVRRVRHLRVFLQPDSQEGARVRGVCLHLEDRPQRWFYEWCQHANKDIPPPASRRAYLLCRCLHLVTRCDCNSRDAGDQAAGVVRHQRVCLAWLEETHNIDKHLTPDNVLQMHPAVSGNQDGACSAEIQTPVTL